jgi:hypothetical protein
VVAFTYAHVKGSENVLQVVGSAKQSITSDTVKWTGQFTRSIEATNIKAGYDQMKKDRTAVMNFLKKKEIDEKAVSISAVFMDQDYSVNNQEPKRYILRQTVDVHSEDVEGLTSIAKNIDDLINQGVLFSTQSLEYTYSKLPELRVSLLKDAMTDARARANSIASSDGKGVGALTSASIGVVQVLSPSSTSVEDYGAYDTSSIEKEVMVTVRASFQVR